MNPRRWLHEHSLKLLAIRDTPQAIAGGVAIGMFFGFTPLFGLKTLGSILFAWLTGSNIIAAVIAGTLHDVIFPFMPVLYRWEYDLGYYLLSSPHHLPPPLIKAHAPFLSWRGLAVLVERVGRYTLLGGVIVAAPFGILSYFVSYRIVERHQRKKQAHAHPADEEETNPS
jgi:uncharacterized protein